MAAAALQELQSIQALGWRGFVGALLVASFAVCSVATAQAPAASGDAPPPAATPEQLEKLVGPIALYPDDLVGIILPASTSPLQLVQADRYLEKRKADPKLPIDDKWDDAVKSLLNYPEVVKKMSGDLDWTVDLGEAVVADQGAVLDAIQAFRRRSQSAGNLKTDDKQVIVVEKEVVKIVPANPQVIYVPQYNPATVVVTSSVPVYGYYAAPYPSYYYPYAPGAALATGLIWGAAIGAAWNGGHYNTNWGGGNNNITVNRGGNTINTGNINTGNINRGGASASQRPTNTAWKSDKSPGQVSGSAGRGQNTGRVGDAGRASTQPAGGGGRDSFGGGDRGAGAGGAGRPSTQPAGGGGRDSFGGGDRASAAGGGGRASTQPAGGGGRDSFGGGGAGGSGGAFGGYGSGSGRQTQMDSSRGAASRSSMSSSSASRGSMGSSGASRGASGGGARAGGGGRGGRR